MTIGGRRFSILAAYTTRGFLFWRIVEGPVTHEIIEEVFREQLEPLIVPGDFLMADNAAIHLAPTTLMEMERITTGRFKFVPTYSPCCSPVEKGFSLVWTYVRAREDRAARDPVGVINEAFQYYSTTGPKGYKARGHFNNYKRYHRRFLAGDL